jgi:hypothetical protein
MKILSQYTEAGWEVVLSDGKREHHFSHFYYRDYPIFEDLPLSAQGESVRTEWEAFWRDRERGETGESSGEPCPGQPGDSPPRAPTL